VTLLNKNLLEFITQPLDKADFRGNEVVKCQKSRAIKRKPYLSLSGHSLNLSIRKTLGLRVFLKS